MLAHEGLFVNTASDLGLLPLALQAGASFQGAPARDAIERDQTEHAVEPLFVRGFRAEA